MTKQVIYSYIFICHGCFGSMVHRRESYNSSSQSSNGTVGLYHNCLRGTEVTYHDFSITYIIRIPAGSQIFSADISLSHNYSSSPIYQYGDTSVFGGTVAKLVVYHQQSVSSQTSCNMNMSIVLRGNFFHPLTQ